MGAFQTVFAAEYHDQKEQDKVNTAQNNFHSANSAVDITLALENLAMAAISDRDIAAQLTKINQQLTTTTNNLSEQLHTVLATNTALVAKLNAAPTANTKTGPATMSPSAATSGRRPFDKAAWITSLNPNGYCWTHGYRVTTSHDSNNFKEKILGHVNAATRTDTRGGSIKNKPN